MSKNITDRQKQIVAVQEILTVKKPFNRQEEKMY